MRTLFAVAGMALVSAAGCQPRLADSRTLTLEVGEISVIVLDPVGKQQKIRVTAKSPGAPVSVYIYLNEHDAEVERKITLDKPTELIIASQVKSEDIALEATIPANQEAAVRVASGSRETATVDLSISN